MYMVHTAFRREFALMPALIRGVGTRDRARLQTIADHLKLINMLLHDHHEAEDKHLWPKLLDRALAEVGPIVHLMEQQHENIATALIDIDDRLRVWCADASLESARMLADSLDRIVPILFEHMDVEESRVLPLVEKYITATEWNNLILDAAAQIPQANLFLAFGMMMYEGNPETIKAAVSRMPEEVRSTITELAPRAFASHSLCIYGTTTPPRGEVIFAGERSRHSGSITAFPLEWS